MRLKKLFTILLSVFLLAGFFTAGSPWTGYAAGEELEATASASNSVTTKSLAPGTSYATTMYIIKSNVAGPVFMVVGGTHGDEPAGFKAAAQVKDIRVKKGTLIVIPQANRQADLAGTRTCPGVGDLNRSYPDSASGKPDDVLAQAIWNAVKTYNVTWLIDMHEGYNYHNTYSPSVGQSIIYYPNGSTTRLNMATSVVNTLNKSISDPKKQFAIIRYPTPTSLARATAQFLGVNAYTFETCDKQSLNVRINQHLTAVKTILGNLGML